MKKLQIFSILLGSFVFLIFGCSTVKILQTEKVPEFSLSDYKTFDFYELEVDASDMPGFDKRVAWIEEEIISQFEMNGISQSDENPDLLVNIGIVLWEETQTRETDYRTDGPKYIGSMNYSWQSETVEVGTYLKGTVVIHFVERKDKTLVWEGIVQGVVEEKDEKSRKKIKTGVNQLFETLK